MDLLKRITKVGFFIYLIYVFIFAIIIFSFNKPSTSKDMEDTLSQPLSESRKNDRVTLIESAEDAIMARLSLIQNAHSHINLSYYKFTDGKVANLMLGSLVEAADRGVEVKILLDGVIQLANFNKKINDVFLGFMSHPNIEIKLYEPFNPFLPLAWNNRLHDKMILVDNKLALIGGRNIEDRFYLKDVYGDDFVEDRDVLIYHDIKNDSSSVIDEMQVYYSKLWNSKYSKPKYKYLTKRRINKGQLSIDNLRLQHKSFKEEFLKMHFPHKKNPDWTKTLITTNGIRFISNPIGRVNQDPQCLKAILQLSSMANKHIFIQSPYFIPSKNIQSLFAQYKIDLEKTTILTNSKASSPNIISIAAYKNYKKAMVDSRMNIFEFQGPGSIHAKTSIFDEKISVIGTFNIDPRSSYISSESIVIIDSQKFSKTLKKAVDNNLTNSLKVDEDYAYIEKKSLRQTKLPKLKNIMINVLSKITPFIEYLL